MSESAGRSEGQRADLLIRPVDPQRQDVAALLEQADAYLLSRYPADLCFLDDATALTEPHVTLLGAFRGDELVGMGAVKIISDADERGGDFGEIKRVFVREVARGGGIGRRLMQALESHLLHRGLALVRLETGTEQPEAVSLYTKLGYTIRAPFGDYPENPMSIFMEKELKPGRGGA